MSDPLKGVRLQSVENHDAKALTEEQQAKLDKKKVSFKSESPRNHFVYAEFAQQDSNTNRKRSVSSKSS